MVLTSSINHRDNIRFYALVIDLCGEFCVVVCTKQQVNIKLNVTKSLFVRYIYRLKILRRRAIN